MRGWSVMKGMSWMPWRSTTMSPRALRPPYSAAGNRNGRCRCAPRRSRTLRFGPGGLAAVAQFEIEIAGIDEDAEALAQNEDRVANVKRVAEQQDAAADGEEPERNRHHHLAGTLGGNPLHHEAHREHDLRGIAEQYDPLEFGHEHC